MITMDLRKRLFSRLAVLLLALVAISAVIDLAFLVPDIERETRGSANLTKELIAIGNASCTSTFADGLPALPELLRNVPLRHVRVSLNGEPWDEAPSGIISALSDRVFSATRWTAPETLNINGYVISFTPDPTSEMQERLEGAGRTLLLLLGFSVASMAAVWLAVDNALKPVRMLEKFIRGLAENKKIDRLPSFRLKEYAQLATALNTLSVSLSQARNAQKDFSQKVIAAIEAERESIARDLHDEIGQTITALVYTGKFVEMRGQQAGDDELASCCADIRRLTGEMNVQLKEVIKRLRPSGTDVADLIEGIHELIAGWNAGVTGTRFQFEHDDAVALLDSQQTLSFYRIAQESLTNVIRHSRATRCDIAFRKEDGCIVLTIADNGIGIADSDIRMHGGLYGIRERADMMGAELSIAKGALGGVTIRVSLPFNADDQSASTRQS